MWLVAAYLPIGGLTAQVSWLVTPGGHQSANFDGI